MKKRFCFLFWFIGIIFLFNCEQPVKEQSGLMNEEKGNVVIYILETAFIHPRH